MSITKYSFSESAYQLKSDFAVEVTSNTGFIAADAQEISDIQWIDFAEADKHAPYYQGKLKEIALNNGIKYYNQGNIDK